MLKFSLVVLATMIVGTGSAYGYQTEVDQHEMQWRRAGRAEWNREVRRQARLDALAAAEAAAQAEAAEEAVPTSYPTGVLSAEEVAAYARGAGFPESVIPTMVAIAYRESHFNPGAVNPSPCNSAHPEYGHAMGLYQICPSYGDPALLDAATNTARAYAKYAASGLAPWGY